MSSFVDDLDKNVKAINQPLLDKNVEEGEEDLFPHNLTQEENKNKIDNDEELNIQLQQPYFIGQGKSGSSSRRYRKQSKNKFKGKEIETNFQLQRNDPLLNTGKVLSNKVGPNQTMPMFVSHAASPMVANMKGSPNFILSATTKHSKYANSKRPVSAVMAKHLSPHASVELPMFDLNRMRPRNIRKDKISLYDDALKLK